MKEDVNKYDRVIVSQEEVELLFKWRDENKELVRNFNPVMDKGVIINTNTPLVRYAFKKQKNTYLYTIINKDDDEVLHALVWDFTTGIGTNVHTVLEPDFVKEYNEVLISLHASLMAYMEHFKDNAESVRAKTQELVVGYKKHKKTKKRLPVKIRRKIYSVSVTKENLDVVTRAYERHTEQWTVRGHWRKTKNGQVWIKPHVRGEGKEITPKEYKL